MEQAWLRGLVLHASASAQHYPYSDRILFKYKMFLRKWVDMDK